MCSPRLSSLLVFLISFSFLVTACDLFRDSSEGQSFSFEQIEEARRLDVPEAKAVVLRTEAEWEDFWNRRLAVPEGSDRLPPPSVDFDTKMVIGLFWGEVSGCSNTVRAVQTITENVGGIVVQVEDWTEGTICQALVQPRQVIQTKRTPKQVKFEGNAAPGR
jgi:hypothetical protein